MNDEEDEAAPLAYAHNPKPLSGGLRLTLTQDDLIAERSRARQVFALRGIAKITLTFTPRNIVQLAFTCHIRAQDGRRVRFDSITWTSLTQVEQQNEEYHTFVTALIDRASRANPRIMLQAGLPLWRYSAMFGFGVLLVLALAMAGIYALIKGSIPIALFGFGLMAYLGWWLRDTLTRNHPMVFNAMNIPAGVMP